jgi:hypothetical protein
VILTDDDLKQLTKVRCRRNKTRWERQRAVLVQLGIEHRVRPDGSLVVSRQHVEHLLGGGRGGKVGREWQPDFSGN